MQPPPKDAEEIFLDALELEDPVLRARYLQISCDQDESLRQAVQALLDDHGQAAQLFTRSETELLQLTGVLFEDELPLGTQIGPYRLSARLGEGGDGVVYAALQESPVQRELALKVFKPGPNGRALMERFATEKQTLARLEHPNIARVVDAGLIDSGRPYLAMELVRGTHITRYCEEQKLPLSGRLQLMLQVCSAVQHAHQKGIIHRDLKPGNILISVVDGTPVPKIIDFGISKNLEFGNASAAKSAGSSFPGTPAYMSPEQCAQPAVDIDTRSDVYNLGVVLRELATGQVPKPGALAAAATPVPGDLGWIIAKTLKVDREQRYPTVRALGRDLERLLRGEAVEAHPPGRLYRLGKLLQRNRLTALSLAVALLALLGGFVTSTVLYFKASAAEQQQVRLRAEAEERAHVAKAAILLMQERPAEANAEIERLGGLLTQPSLEATKVFHELAAWSALQHDWKTAGKRLLALSHVNRFDDSDQSDNATRDVIALAPLLAETGDRAAYEELCGRLLARLGGTKNPIAAEHLLKMLVQWKPDPQFAVFAEALARVAQNSLDPSGTPKNRIEAWRCGVLGLWAYRGQRDEEALRWCDRVLSCPDTEAALQAYARAIKSMALARLGRSAAAREEFERARLLVEAEAALLPAYERSGFWNDWLTDRQLLREAAERLGR